MPRNQKKDATAFKNWLKDQKKRKGATVRGKVSKGRVTVKTTTARRLKHPECNKSKGGMT